MGWSGIDVIPLLPGEGRRAAVDRVYGGGVVIELRDEGLVTLDVVPGGERDVSYVSKAQRTWMVEAIDVLQELRPGWEIVEQEQGDDRRWPWSIVLEHPEGEMWVQLTTDCATFRAVRGAQFTATERAHWWRTVRRFAKWPAAIYEADTGELIATSLPVRAARERYNWM